MNPFVAQVLGMLVRQGLLMGIGALGLSPIIQPIIEQNQAQWNAFITAIVGAIGVVGYALWRKYFDRQKLLQALGEANLSEHAVTVAVKDAQTPTPSVLTPKHQVPK